MSKFIKAFSIYAVCLMMVCSFVFVPSVASFASPLTETVFVEPTSYVVSTNDLWTSPFDGAIYNVHVPSYVASYVISSLDDPLISPEAIYTFRGGEFTNVTDEELPFMILYLNDVASLQLYYSDLAVLTDDEISEAYLSFVSMVTPVIASGGTASIVFQSYSSDVGIYAIRDVGLFVSAWDIFKEYIYGDMDMTPEMNLTLTLLATLISLAVVVLPFVIIWLIIRFVASLMR